MDHEVDLGAARVFVSPNLVEFAFLYDPHIKDLVKYDLKASWLGSRRRWRILSHKPRDWTEVLERFSKAYEEKAPAGWLSALPTLSSIRCYSNQYAIAVGVAGLRIFVPMKMDERIKAFEGAKLLEDQWNIPAEKAVTEAVRELIIDIVRSDREAFLQDAALLDSMDYRVGLWVPEDVSANRLSRSLAMSDAVVLTRDFLVNSQLMDKSLCLRRMAYRAHEIKQHDKAMSCILKPLPGKKALEVLGKKDSEIPVMDARYLASLGH